jgi:DNA-binding NarL/FixJ family response regulator
MKILVVDDHSLIREALRGALKELEDNVAILEASDGRQAFALAEQNADLDLILLDLSLPDRDGFGLLAELRERFPAVSVVVLSAMDERSHVVRALDLGALGFIPKNASREIMLRALQLVCSGGVYIPPQVLGHDRLAPAPSRPTSRATLPATSPTDSGLTGRKMNVLALMMQGKSNKAIGRALDLAEPTVKNHVTAILKALEVTNRTEAVIAVGDLGWQLPAIAKS